MIGNLLCASSTHNSFCFTETTISVRAAIMAGQGKWIDHNRRSSMRNIFDQYEQPENRLTHALFCTLSNDRRLVRPFLKWLKIGTVPPTQKLRLVEQQVPGVSVSGEEIDAKGLPDGCIFDSDGWVLLFESKVPSVPT